MNTRRKIAIDRILGIVVAIPLNWLVRLVGFLTRFDHSLTKPKQRIIICKFKGMGSIIQSTPLISTLRNKYPEAKIVYVSSIENKGIINEIKTIDEALYVNDSNIFRLIASSISLISKLIRKRADLYIDLEIYSNYSSIIATLSMATDRFGFYSKDSRYRMGMYTHMMYFNTTAPIADVYLQFARMLHCENISTESYRFESEKFDTKNHIVININASDLRIERRWPSNLFTELIHKIRTQYPSFEIYLIGSKTESDYVKTVSSIFETDPNVHDVSGKTSLKELIQLIGEATLVITNDTGPMHIAASMHKKTVALFGPCAPSQYAIGNTIYPIYKNVYCSPCVHEFIIPPCKGNNQCMRLIEVNEVLIAVDLLLRDQYHVLDAQRKMYKTSSTSTLGIVTR